MQSAMIKKHSPLNNLRHLLLAAVFLTFVLMVIGGIMRVSNSTGACADWPTCLGRWTPPDETPAFIDYTHRALSALAIPLLASALFIAAKAFRNFSWIIQPIILANILMFVQIILGAWVSTNVDVNPWISSLHLLFSLLMQTCLLISLVAASQLTANTSLQTTFQPKISLRSPFTRVSLAVFSLSLLLMVSGTAVASMDASQACSSWPLCDLNQAKMQVSDWVNIIHRFFVALNAFAITGLVISAWRTQRTQTTTLVAASATTVLFFAQALLGAKMIDGFSTYLLALHQATALSAWITLSLTVVSSGFSHRTQEDEREEILTIQHRKGLLKDLLMLTKPIVVALLLVTTFAGMVIGAQAWPSFELTFWTLLGGFMAAGGSGAINQYIDRYDDGKMQRTQKRPIPDGRLTASEGLAFGVMLLLSSFFILVAFVNFLAALLSLAGMIYYVVIYSLLLKKTTVQNIVIGGGAGAIPPLVGWAAATGSLNFPSLLLFAVIFMWTPPHFWALALVRRKDYARAGVPMLPVIRGEKETRWQILLYTIELVVLSMMLPLLGLGGSIYLIGAGILGLWLLAAAWKVWRLGGNKLAWKMYRYSSMYLAFLFFVLMADRLM
ncbi:MAG TPA: heme o synthase [Anaerolineales bacterium]|nr:heme o synthase [Anaerolineales bacterium]